MMTQEATRTSRGRRALRQAKPGRVRRAGGVVSLLLAGQMGLTGCNGDTNDAALPPGSQVLVQPSSQQFTVTERRDANGNCQYGQLYQDIPVLVSVTAGSNNTPIGEAPLTFSLNFTGQTFSGPSVLKLYADRNGNGVVDDPEELVSDAGQPLFETKTARFSGEQLMLVRMDLACAFRGSLFVVSGASLGELTLEVVKDTGAGGG